MEEIYVKPKSIPIAFIKQYMGEIQQEPSQRQEPERKPVLICLCGREYDSWCRLAELASNGPFGKSWSTDPRHFGPNPIENRRIAMDPAYAIPESTHGIRR